MAVEIEVFVLQLVVSVFKSRFKLFFGEKFSIFRFLHLEDWIRFGLQIGMVLENDQSDELRE